MAEIPQSSFIHSAAFADHFTTSLSTPIPGNEGLGLVLSSQDPPNRPDSVFESFPYILTFSDLTFPRPYREIQTRRGIQTPQSKDEEIFRLYTTEYILRRPASSARDGRALSEWSVPTPELGSWPLATLAQTSCVSCRQKQLLGRRWHNLQYGRGAAVMRR